MILIEAGCPVLDMNEFDRPQERSALEFAGLQTLALASV